MCKLTLLDVIDDVYRALDAKAYLSAMALSLTIPDTLAQVTYPELKGRHHVRERYVRWFNEYYICRPKPHGVHDSQCTVVLDNVIEKLDGNFFYELRNSFLHSDSNDITKHMIDLDFELSFESGNMTSVYGNGSLYLKYHVLSVPDFCKTVCIIAEHLLDKWEKDIQKQSELERFTIKIRNELV